jgi:hypothetical protein
VLPHASPELVLQLDPGMADYGTDYDRYVESCLSGSLPQHESDDWQWSSPEVSAQCVLQHLRSAPGPDSILPVMLAHIGDAGSHW